MNIAFPGSKGCSFFFFSFYANCSTVTTFTSSSAFCAFAAGFFSSLVFSFSSEFSSVLASSPALPSYYSSWASDFLTGSFYFLAASLAESSSFYFITYLAPFSSFLISFFSSFAESSFSSPSSFSSLSSVFTYAEVVSAGLFACYLFVFSVFSLSSYTSSFAIYSYVLSFYSGSLRTYLLSPLISFFAY